MKGASRLVCTLGVLLLICLGHVQASLRAQKLKSAPLSTVLSLTRRAPRPVADMPASSLRLTLPSGVQHLPLLGSLDTTSSFYLPLSIGTPPQKLNILVDTGSTDLVVFADGCSGCPRTAANYSQSRSSTGSSASCQELDFQCSNDCSFSMTCAFADDYGGGGKIVGSVLKDVVTLGSWALDHVFFGAINDDEVSGDFVIPPEDGIMGLAFDTLSAWRQPCAFTYAVQQQNAYNSFSMCLDATPVLELGTNYYATQKSAFNWTEMYNSPGWLSVYLEDMGMGGTSLGIGKSSLNRANVIVDSGTTFLIVSSEMMKVFTKRLDAMCASGVNLVGVCNETAKSSILAGNCFNMTEADVALYPSVYFSLYNPDDSSAPFTLTIGPDAYMQQVCGGVGQGYAFGIQAMDSTPVIIGDVLIQKYHVVFDKQAMRIGFGPLSGCPKTE